MDKGMCLEIDDYNGNKVIFYETTRVKKAKKRPELREKSFLNGQLREAIKNPWRIYEDFDRPKERHAYYYKEYSTREKTQYAKVVIEISAKPFIVITAYRPDRIKEESETSKSKKIYDSEKYQ